MNISDYLEEKCKIVDDSLENCLPPEDRFPEVIYKAMRYSVLNGGKRFRPILVISACESVGGKTESALPTACAIELIHAFSLIHDDLPALDNDDFRRGKPTNHKVFGEATAILAGDALLALAFEVLTTYTKTVDAGLVLNVARRIANATGMGGMVVGQMVDIISENKEITPQMLEFMHENKTGALIRESVVCGGIIGGASESQVAVLEVFGKKVGLAFQIADDILDIEGDEELIGKTVGSDLRKQKSTYPSLFGLEQSKELARKTVDDAIKDLKDFDERADTLRELANYVIQRES